MKRRLYHQLNRRIASFTLFGGAILMAFLLALNAPFSVNAERMPNGKSHIADESTGLTLAVDASSEQGTISPYIYGMNFAEEAIAQELALPINRWGGNATTRYNWQHDTSNRASDWFFENIPNDNANPELLPNGSASDKFVEQNLATGTASLLTVPLIGWTPKSRGYDCGFSVSKYGQQQQVDPWNSDCGNGVSTDGTFIMANDPLDSSSAIDESFVQAWIEHLTTRYGRRGALTGHNKRASSASGRVGESARGRQPLPFRPFAQESPSPLAEGGVSFYSLDNEPMLWNMTHRDVHPSSTSYDEMRDRSYQYGAAIKASDASAQIIGPALWGWTAYFYSALDWEPGGAWWSNPQDRNAHGGLPFIEWYLQQMRLYEEQHGVRILDYLDLHYYPQNVALGEAGDADRQALRLRSTRSLWDASYTDESWINEPVELIPRMSNWVTLHYPGTKLALSEYNWGALDDINGALAQADVLGIFGREGLDMATLWAPPASDEPGMFAFRFYRNYDGKGSTFGDTSLSASSDDQAQLAIYAAKRSSDRALTLIVINKTGNQLSSNVTLSGFNPSSSAEVYRYSAANLSAIVQEAKQAVTASGFSAPFPANSITLFVLKPASADNLTETLYLPIVVR